MIKAPLLAFCLLFCTTLTSAAELAGVFVDDTVKTEAGRQLVLNGAGLREKFWVDVYVGSLFLEKKSSDLAEILSSPGPWRVQLNFIYKEVAQEKLLEGWREGFNKNQSEESLRKLQERIDQFNGFFDSSAVAGDRYRFEYDPASGTRVSKNDSLLGVIPGNDFSNALLEIWLGNYPADKGLKKGMLGL
jgi:hypothetical protein